MIENKDGNKRRKTWLKRKKWTCVILMWFVRHPNAHIYTQTNTRNHHLHVENCDNFARKIVILFVVRVLQFAIAISSILKHSPLMATQKQRQQITNVSFLFPFLYLHPFKYSSMVSNVSGWCCLGKWISKAFIEFVFTCCAFQCNWLAKCNVSDKQTPSDRLVKEA